jgi:hypothetical protein
MRRLEAYVGDASRLSHCPVVRTAPLMQPKEKRLERRRKYVEERRSFKLLEKRCQNEIRSVSYSLNIRHQLGTDLTLTRIRDGRSNRSGR